MIYFNDLSIKKIDLQKKIFSKLKKSFFQLNHVQTIKTFLLYHSFSGKVS